MKFEIRKTMNGTVLRVEADDEGAVDEVVYQEREDHEIEAFADFLREVLEHFGPVTSRYSKKRIFVVVRPGDKYVHRDGTPEDDGTDGEEDT